MTGMALAVQFTMPAGASLDQTALYICRNGRAQTRLFAPFLSMPQVQYVAAGQSQPLPSKPLFPKALPNLSPGLPLYSDIRHVLHHTRIHGQVSQLSATSWKETGPSSRPSPQSILGSPAARP